MQNTKVNVNSKAKAKEKINVKSNEKAKSHMNAIVNAKVMMQVEMDMGMETAMRMVMVRVLVPIVLMILTISCDGSHGLRCCFVIVFVVFHICLGFPCYDAPLLHLSQVHHHHYDNDSDAADVLGAVDATTPVSQHSTCYSWRSPRS